jgi:aspartyl-tRNA(Asn)/glutamyl-tRNA(Gln) amidotransferase subunit B
LKQTVLLGSDPTKARSWWLGEVSRIANDRAVSPTELISVNDVAQIIELISSG